MEENTNYSTTPVAPSLKRSLSKVKSAITSKFKVGNSANDENIEASATERHVLKAMKYEETTDIASSTSANNTTSNSNILLSGHDETIQGIESRGTARAQKSLSVPCLVTYGGASSIASEILLHKRSESLSTSGGIISPNQTMNQPKMEKTGSIEPFDEFHCKSEEKLLPTIEEPSRSPNDSIFSEISDNSSVPSSAFKAPVLPINIPFNEQTEKNSLAGKSLRLNTMISPPVSPSGTKQFGFDPISEVREENASNAEDRTTANDFADAVALSILDKVDDNKETSEWRI